VLNGGHVAQGVLVFSLGRCARKRAGARIQFYPAPPVKKRFFFNFAPKNQFRTYGPA
jgi:hypothetical protein